MGSSALTVRAFASIKKNRSFHAEFNSIESKACKSSQFFMLNVYACKINHLTFEFALVTD